MSNPKNTKLAQERGRWRGLADTLNVGRAAGEFFSGSYKEEMGRLREADNEIGKLAMGLKPNLKDALKALKTKKYLDFFHYADAVNKILKDIKAQVDPFVSRRDDHLSEFYGDSDVFDESNQYSFAYSIDEIIKEAGVLDWIASKFNSRERALAALEKLHSKRVKEQSAAMDKLSMKLSYLVNDALSTVKRLGGLRSSGDLSGYINAVANLEKNRSGFENELKAVYSKYMRSVVEYRKRKAELSGEATPSQSGAPSGPSLSGGSDNMPYGIDAGGFRTDHRSTPEIISDVWTSAVSKGGVNGYNILRQLITDLGAAGVRFNPDYTIGNSLLVIADNFVVPIEIDDLSLSVFPGLNSANPKMITPGKLSGDLSALKDADAEAIKAAITGGSISSSTKEEIAEVVKEVDDAVKDDEVAKTEEAADAKAEEAVLEEAGEDEDGEVDEGVVDETLPSEGMKSTVDISSFVGGPKADESVAKDIIETAPAGGRGFVETITTDKTKFDKPVNSDEAIKAITKAWNTANRGGVLDFDSFVTSLEGSQISLSETSDIDDKLLVVLSGQFDKKYVVPIRVSDLSEKVFPNFDGTNLKSPMVWSGDLARFDADSDVDGFVTPTKFSAYELFSGGHNVGKAIFEVVGTGIVRFTRLDINGLLNPAAIRLLSESAGDQLRNVRGDIRCLADIEIDSYLKTDTLDSIANGTRVDLADLLDKLEVLNPVGIYDLERVRDPGSRKITGIKIVKSEQKEEPAVETSSGEEAVELSDGAPATPADAPKETTDLSRFFAKRPVVDPEVAKDIINEAPGNITNDVPISTVSDVVDNGEMAAADVEADKPSTVVVEKSDSPPVAVPVDVETHSEAAASADEPSQEMAAEPAEEPVVAPATSAESVAETPIKEPPVESAGASKTVSGPPRTEISPEDKASEIALDKELGIDNTQVGNSSAFKNVKPETEGPKPSKPAKPAKPAVSVRTTKPNEGTTRKSFRRGGPVAALNNPLGSGFGDMLGTEGIKDSPASSNITHEDVIADRSRRINPDRSVNVKPKGREKAKTTNASKEDLFNYISDLVKLAEVYRDNGEVDEAEEIMNIARSFVVGL